MQAFHNANMRKPSIVDWFGVCLLTLCLSLIHAPSSRKKLNITKAMLQALLSQYEVMPTFLDFLFTFGKQSFKKNFHYSGFRTKEIAGGTQLFAKVPTISDTTSKYQMCYNLRSVEPTSNPPDWQWSIRQTAVFHSFDMLSGNTNWITVKGNRDMFDSFKQVTRPSAPSCPNHYNSKAGAFDASLAAHLVFCEWSSKNWAEYVGFLEERLQTKTRYALLATVEHPERQDAEIARPDRTETVPVALPRRFTLTEGRKAVQKGFRSLLATHRETSKAVSAKDLELGLMDEKHVADSGFEDFSYDDLRKIQFVEDQTNIAHLVVKSNISILSDLKSYYTNLEASKEFCEVYGTECDVAISRFSSQVTAIINDLRLQQSRLETLLRLIADRKSLVNISPTTLFSNANNGQLFQLFEHRNMSANKAFTKKAQQSADNMELLTREMRAIATKTEAETIFMRIVTLVTLFFLPGTFVAVSLFPLRAFAPINDNYSFS